MSKTDSPPSKSIAIGDIELRTEVGRQHPIAQQYYVTFSLGNVSRSTEITKEVDGRTSWNQIFHFDGDDNTILLVLVYQNNPIGSGILVGNLVDTIGEALEKSRDSVLEGVLRRDTLDGPNLSGITIKFALAAQPLSALTLAERQAADFDDRVTTVKTRGSVRRAVKLLNSAVSVGNGGVANEMDTFQTTWPTLLRRMSILNQIVTGIAQIHPHILLAWSVISAADRLLVKKKTCDNRVVRLAGTMSDAFMFVQDTEPLKKINEHINTIKVLLQQVAECGYFIIDYTKNEFFWIRSGRYTTLAIDTMITRYNDKLRELQNALVEGVQVQTGATIIRMMNAVEDNESIMMDDVPYASGAKFDRERACLPGTCETSLREICDVLNDPDDNAPRVCLLTGVAGSGKSAIAHSIARLYDDQERLGSSYVFDISNVANLSPKNVFSTIARDLSDRDPQFKSALWQIIEDDEALRTSQSPMQQIEGLITKPSKNLHRIGPLVIVIDGLDESGNEYDCQQFLWAISEKIAENALPTNLRFLITARTEADILTRLPTGPQVTRKDMTDIPKHIIDGDIERFIRQSLHQYTALESFATQKKWYQLLVRRSGRLFQWTSTACSFIRGNGTEEPGMRQRFEVLVTANKNDDLHPLDRLYRTILEQQFTSDNAQRLFREVMAVILALNEPLPLASLSALFVGRLDVRDVVKRLGSFLDGVVNEEKPIRLFHSSFRDFLLDEARSSMFHAKTRPLDSLHLGQALLACMRSMLRFNMCDLQDSRILNDGIPDLPTRVNQVIPPYLAYSCRYWMSHLQYAECTPDLLVEVTHFVQDVFPYWFESISLLSLIPQLSSIPFALDTCSILRRWSHDKEVASLALEAFQFLAAFTPVLKKSTPHLYLSCMPQTPSSSPLSKLWAGHLQRHISIRSGKGKHWAVKDHALKGHTGGISSVAYSPDSIHVVSGSEDNTIRIWNAITGQSVGGPLKGHTDSITAVAYSPDGSQVISCSSDKTIKMWNASTGEAMGDPFQGHTDAVSSLAYSPDKIHIASGSWDKTIRVWNTKTGQCVAGPFQGHTDLVSSIAYSPDGVHIVSGSWDNTIRIWNASTGVCVVGPLQGHSDPVTSVAYSPDGTSVASGSKDKTIQVWNSTTGQSIANPFTGHDETVSSVAYSPDGMYIASGSWDAYIRIWEASTGKCVLSPSQEHQHHVTSVAYSPDGFYIISGSWDKSIRIWQASISQSTASSAQTHSASVKSVAFSPDGNQIVSGSSDQTIRVWDATTGELVQGPFEGHSGSINSVTFSPDGIQIASGSSDNTIRVWDAATGQSVVGPMQGHTDSVRSIAYSPDGIYIASGSSDKTIRVWNASTGQLVTGPFQECRNTLKSVSYSPDGTHIVSGSRDGAIRVWDAATGQLILDSFQGQERSVRSVTYSPDGMHIISGSTDDTIRVWNATTGQPIGSPFQGHGDSVLCVSCSPDGIYIVSGSRDDSIRVWNATTGQCVAGPYQGHTNNVNSIAYSPNGKYIVTGSRDSSIKVWGTQELLSFDNFSRKNNWIQSSDGSYYGWIPPWAKDSFYLPVHSLVIALDQIHQIDSDNSLFGESWVSCWK